MNGALMNDHCNKTTYFFTENINRTTGKFKCVGSSLYTREFYKVIGLGKSTAAQRPLLLSCEERAMNQQ